MVIWNPSLAFWFIYWRINVERRPHSLWLVGFATLVGWICVILATFGEDAIWEKTTTAPLSARDALLSATTCTTPQRGRRKQQRSLGRDFFPPVSETCRKPSPKHRPTLGVGETTTDVSPTFTYWCAKALLLLRSFASGNKRRLGAKGFCGLGHSGESAIRLHATRPPEVRHQRG